MAHTQEGIPMDTLTTLDLDPFPIPFRPAIRRIHALHTLPRYQAAYIFGSVARGAVTAASDLDVHVVVDDPHPCTTINHPLIDGIPVDITFCSLEHLMTRTEREIAKAERIPMVAESLILFDKTGDLTRLRTTAQDARPTPTSPAAYPTIQFLVLHANNKVERFLCSDPVAALLVMHTSLSDLLHIHYDLQGRWRVSDKRLLGDLRLWDPCLADVVERLVRTADVPAKFAAWTELIAYILAPFGGRQPIAKHTCACAMCQHDLAMLFRSSAA
jgi:predicted nucleotidyltransferase